MFMDDFGHIKTAVKCKLFKQYCCSYYGAPLWVLQSKCWQYMYRMAQGTQTVVGTGTSYTRHTAMLSHCCLIVGHY